MNLPIFLDFEASSLSHESYPIEVAFSDEKGEIESHLINPYAYPKNYTDWDFSSQQIHGLSRKELSEKGKHPKAIAKRMNDVLKGKVVYTDAAEFDQFWCDRLFDAYDIMREFKFAEIDILLQDILPVEYFYAIFDRDNQFQIDVIKDQVRQVCEDKGIKRHRAANDVIYLIELYKKAVEFKQ